MSDELREQSIRNLLSIGTSAAKSGDIPKAQSALSRVLAIDDGNERALKLLGTLGRRHRRNTLAAVAAATVLVGLAGLGYATWLESRPVSPPPEEKEAAAASTEAEDAARASSEIEPEPTTDQEPTSPPPTAEAVPSGPRWVVFKPTPPNVSISVDGGPLKPYGPGFQRVRLKVGRHTFRFVGAEGCCEERLLRKRIPPGARDYELAVKLRFKPARLYLKGPAPSGATVRITLPGGRTIAGRIREIFRVPMSSLRASAQVQIRAPGYRTHKSVVSLRAGGDLTEHSFALERQDETP